VVMKEEKIEVKKGFAFMINQQNGDQHINLNPHITKILDQLVDVYNAIGDTWRVYAYRKAADIFKRLKKEIKTEQDVELLEEADIRGLGAKMIEKVKEIVDKGSLEKLENFQNDPRVQILHRFSQIWGVGSSTAQKWYNLGYRTFEDLKAAQVLNHQQQVGVKYYDELLQRIPRSEVEEIELVVKKAFQDLIIKQGADVSKLQVITCGSYRRLLPTCGDVDILISHESEDILDGLLLKGIHYLEQIGFLTDHLSLPSSSKHIHLDDPDAVWSSSYMGVCQLSPVKMPAFLKLMLIFC
jgi:DNA polymerase lambda